MLQRSQIDDSDNHYCTAPSSPLWCGMFRLGVLLSFLVLPANVWAQAQDVGEFSIIGLLMLIILVVGIPGVISFAIRILTRDNIASYLGTYIIIAIGYMLARNMTDFVIDGSAITVGLILLVPTMLGAVLAQTVYYVRLPKR